MYPAIVKCKECGYIYADLDLSQEKFEELYNSGYFKGEEYSDYISDKEMLQRNFNDRLKTLKKYIDPNIHQSLLEVGTAYGFFLELASKEFNEAVGVDVTEEGVKYARENLNLNAYVADLLEWDFKDKKINIACMWDTIEHLRSPHLYIEKISNNMDSGGLIAITTGDIDSFVARWRKNKWRLIHPPTHAHYFSKDSITRLLDKYGYDVVHFEYSGFYRSIDNIAYNLFVLRSNFSWLYRLLKFTRITKLNLYTNLYDIMYVIGRKRNS
jgi:SAM-dependent methyltransferase